MYRLLKKIERKYGFTNDSGFVSSLSLKNIIKDKESEFLERSPGVTIIPKTLMGISNRYKVVCDPQKTLIESNKYYLLVNNDKEKHPFIMLKTVMINFSVYELATDGEKIIEKIHHLINMYYDDSEIKKFGYVSKPSLFVSHIGYPMSLHFTGYAAS